MCRAYERTFTLCDRCVSSLLEARDTTGLPARRY